MSWNYVEIVITDLQHSSASVLSSEERILERGRQIWRL